MGEDCLEILTGGGLGTDSHLAHAYAVPESLAAYDPSVVVMTDAEKAGRQYGSVFLE